MNWRERWIEPKAAWIAAGTVAVIVYGSLYPFQFQPHAASGGPVRALLATWHAATSRGDLIANVLLYIPFGFFVFRSLSRPASFLRCMIVLAAGSLLSIAMELTQFYEPSRDSAMTDVYANTVGALLGSIAGAIFRIDLRLAKTSNLTKRPFVALLVASWLGYRLFPFVPVIDLHKYWAALKPLLFSPTLYPMDLYTHTVIWLAIALLFEALFGMARSRLAILLFVPAVLFARVLIEGTVLSPAEVVGGLLAIPVWVALSRFHPRAAVVAALLAAVIIVQGLEPFLFTGRARSFGWIPFLGFMRGSLELNVRSFFEKVFTYGAFIWLMTRAGLTLMVATLFGGVLVFGVRLAQVYLPGRSAEITDVIILVAAAAVMRLMGEDPRHLHEEDSRPIQSGQSHSR